MGEVRPIPYIKDILNVCLVLIFGVEPIGSSKWFAEQYFKII